MKNAVTLFYVKCTHDAPGFPRYLCQNYYVLFCRVETPTTPNSSSTLAERTPLTETPEATGLMGEVRDDLNDSLFEAMSACSLQTPKVVGLRLPPLQDEALDFNIFRGKIHVN